MEQIFQALAATPFPNRALIQMPGKLFVSAKQRDGHR
jgi:hypothetical protein